MLDISKYNGIVCECSNTEIRQDVLGLLEDYDIPMASNLYDDITKKHKYYLVVKDGFVTHKRKVQDGTILTHVQFLNKLINCEQSKEQ